MRAEDVKLVPHGEGWELSARVVAERYDTGGLRVHYRFPGRFSDGELDASPFLAALVPVAMRLGEDLTIDGPVSARLLDQAPEAVAVLGSIAQWAPVRVFADAVAGEPRPGVTAASFSRGADSWYTVLRHLPRGLTHVVHVPDVEIVYSDATKVRALAAVADAAERVGCELVVVESNARQLTEPLMDWNFGHGPFIASAGLAVGVSTFLLPATFHFGVFAPLSSHPVLPKWSTERTAIVHDGAEATRLQKVRFLADHPVALETLKVCYEADTEFNCGRCQKCLVTMTALHIAGVLDSCPTFPVPLSRRAILGLPLTTVAGRIWWTDILPALGPSRRDRQLWRAIQVTMAKADLRASVKEGKAALHSAADELLDRGLGTLER